MGNIMYFFNGNTVFEGPGMKASFRKNNGKGGLAFIFRTGDGTKNCLFHRSNQCLHERGDLYSPFCF